MDRYPSDQYYSYICGVRIANHLKLILRTMTADSQPFYESDNIVIEKYDPARPITTSPAIKKTYEPLIQTKEKNARDDVYEKKQEELHELVLIVKVNKTFITNRISSVNFFTQSCGDWYIPHTHNGVNMTDIKHVIVAFNTIALEVYEVASWAHKEGDDTWVFTGQPILRPFCQAKDSYKKLPRRLKNRVYHPLYEVIGEKLSTKERKGAELGVVFYKSL